MTKKLWLKIHDAKSYGATLRWYEMVSVSNEKAAQEELLKNVQKLLSWLSQKWYEKVKNNSQWGSAISVHRNKMKLDRTVCAGCAFSKWKRNI